MQKADADVLSGVLSELVQVNSRLVQAIRRIARENGQGDSLAGWRTLGVLQRSGPSRVGVLAETSQVAQPTMTKLVTGLAARGWVERLADPDDARAWRIGITADGAAALAEWRAGLASALLPYFGDLDADDIEALRRTVQVIDSHIVALEPNRNDQTQEVAQ
ncbi:MAG: MarR family winged helix-turn-helix transcriptional regulator [Microbacteriaceae bacterium]|nr:MarR family winged helix-turn-helix transcriptional regulator [Microbacteriaceae bacterium]MCL2795568.1 MarR family winged helix-turn-helix transcriptional regulator [Microbacteriaceae bacterium]